MIPLSGPGAYEDDVQGGSGISSKASFPAGQDDYCCRVVSESVMRGDSVVEGDADVSFRADASLAPGEPEWANYVKGVVKEYTGRVRLTLEGNRLTVGFCRGWFYSRAVPKHP